MPPSLVCLDLETSSPNAAVARIREIGMVAVGRPDVPHFHRVVRMPVGEVEEAEARGIHGIPAEEGVCISQAIAEAYDWLRQFDKVEWLGHNVGTYDVPILTRVIREHGFPAIRASYRFRDTAAVALALKDAGRIPKSAHSLGDLCAWAGLARPPHRALQDAVIGADLYTFFVSILRDAPPILG